MALRAVLDHPKFWDLTQKLNKPRYQVLGILETLWQFTGRYTPHGNIGKYSNKQISSWIGWDGDPDELIDALVEAHWVDTDTEYRLVIHDWNEHADHTTKTALKRANEKTTNKNLLEQCSHSVRTVFAPPEPVPEPVPEPDKTLGGFCNKTPPSTSDETLDNPSTSRVKPSKYTTQELEALWKVQLASYPSRGKADRCVAKGKLAYFKLLRDGEDPQTILRGTHGYTAAMKTLGNADTAYVKQLPTFFHNRTWEEYLNANTGSNGRPQPPHLTPLQMADGCSYVWSENTWKLFTPSNDFEVTT